MAGAAMLAGAGARRTDPVPMLALAAALMLGVDPQLVEDPGFQLSFLGTAGILLLASPIAARIPAPRVIAEPFAVTVAAQLATFAQKVRAMDLRKAPSIAETLDWARSLLLLGASTLDRELARSTLGVILKHEEDRTKVETKLATLV